jgi:hypothetical protein
MFIKQLTVFVENRTGCLSEITELFANNNIDMKALSIADTKDFGLLRLIVDDPIKAMQLLNSQGMVAKITDVIAVDISNKPGALSKVMVELTANNVNVEYLYAFLAGKADSACVVLKASDNDKAEKILKGKTF